VKLVFMGTPAFAVPALAALLRHHEVTAVCTQPDRPAGRGKKITPSPVKELAVQAGIEVLQPETLFIKKGDSHKPQSPREVRDRLRSLGADIFIVAAYGLLLPKAVLEMPRLGCVNIHASVLPRYRGASPIHAALLNGDATTGITIMQMAEGLDTGDILYQRELSIGADEHFPSLHDRMAALGAECIIAALSALEKGALVPTPQNHAQASHAPIIHKTDGLIHWDSPSATIINQVRALDPWPGAYTIHEETPLKIWRIHPAALLPRETEKPPGTVLCADNAGLKIRTADGAVLATALQGQGGKRMPAGDYLRGRSVKVGMNFLHR